MKKMLVIMIPILIIVVVAILLQTVIFIGYVPSASMEPTLKKDSYILGIRPHGDLKKGDVIIFAHEDRTLVKRIAAVGGETIEIEEVSYTVPDGCFLVLGDNSENSYDSRYWENPYVHQSAVLAKLILPRGNT